MNQVFPESVSPAKKAHKVQLVKEEKRVLLACQANQAERANPVCQVHLVHGVIMAYQDSRVSKAIKAKLEFQYLATRVSQAYLDQRAIEVSIV